MKLDDKHFAGGRRNNKRLFSRPLAQEGLSAPSSNGDRNFIAFSLWLPVHRQILCIYWSRQSVGGVVQFIDDRRARVALIVLASLALADCGGGGDGGTPAVNPDSGPPATLSMVTSGSFMHGTQVTVTGSRFGSKSSALPVVFDTGNGPNPNWGSWDGFWPNANPTYDVAYRDLTVQRGISMAHTHNTQYITGAHYSSGGPEAGYNVIFWKNRNIASYPAYTYVSWYQRMDNAWVFESPSSTTNNLKNFAFSVCCSPYELPNNWYIEYNARPTSPGSGASWNITDDGASLQFPDRNGENSFWFGAVNPMSGAWTKIEQEIRYSRQSDGYIKLWENGVLKINYAGPTDRYSGTMRTEGIGGYATSRNINNWRYFADVYLDYTRQRVVLANNGTLSQASIVETQIPIAWSDTSIGFLVNLGRLPSGTAWLFIVNATGKPNTAGLPVTIP